MDPARSTYGLVGVWRLCYVLCVWVPLVVLAAFSFVLWFLTRNVPRQQFERLLASDQGMQFIVMLVVMAAFSGGVSWLGYLALKQTRLELSPEGITHHQLGWSVSARWRDVVALIGLSRGVLTVPALHLSRSELHGNRVMTWIIHALGQDRHIPLMMFSRRWRDSRLKQELERYIPDAMGVPGRESP